MEASALKHQSGLSLQARAPLLRLQSDERLVTLTRRGMAAAFEVLLKRYEARLLAFCRHMLGSREDAEDVLQEVFAAAYNAMVADTRPINVRPWLYRIARNRSLNHLRRVHALGVDSMDVHLSEHGATTADKVHEREEFRQLVGDIHQLPETQRTALVLREMDALSYEQIAEAMETTVSSVKSLLVRARVSLAEAAEARALSCTEVRIELGEVAEGLLRKPSPLVRRHLRTCSRCDSFRLQLRETNRQLAALMPVGALVLLKQALLAHLGHSAGSGAAANTSAVAGTAAAGSAAAAGSFVGGAGAGSFVTAGFGALATKAAAGLAAAALVTASAVEVERSSPAAHPAAAPTASPAVPQPAPRPVPEPAALLPRAHRVAVGHATSRTSGKPSSAKAGAGQEKAAAVKTGSAGNGASAVSSAAARAKKRGHKPATDSGRTQTQTDATVLSPSAAQEQTSRSADSRGSTTPGSTSTTSQGTTTSPGTTTSSGTSTTPQSTTTSPATSTTPQSTTTSPATSTTPQSTTTSPATSTTPTTTATTTATSPDALPAAGTTATPDAGTTAGDGGATEPGASQTSPTAPSTFAGDPATIAPSSSGTLAADALSPDTSGI